MARNFLFITILYFLPYGSSFYQDEPINQYFYALSDRNFIYNNTYRYEVPYTIIVNSSIEYILEFHEDDNKWSVYPARVKVSSLDINSTYPVFISAQQQKGMVSWQLPLVVQTTNSKEQFSSMARTLCPHLVSHDPPILNRPLLHVTTSSPDNVAVDIRVNRVTDFYINIENETEVIITPGTPQYYYFSFERDPFNQSSRFLPNFHYDIPKSVIVMIESDDDVCAVISIQNDTCPVFDDEREILYQGYYLSMTRKGGITLTQSMFHRGFYLVFIVRESDEECTGVPYKPGESDSTGRMKKLRFRVVATISYKEYLMAAVLTLTFFFSFYFLSCVAVLCCRRRTTDSSSTALLTDDAIPTTSAISQRPYENIYQPDDGSASDQPEYNNKLERSVSDSDAESDELGLSARICQLPARLTLSALAKKQPRVISQQTDKYLWNIVTVSILYALPVVQLVITYQGILNQTGNQDLCYYNFLCAHPLGFLSDFNHVYSNLGYVLLGILFLIQVRRKHTAHKLSPELQHLGIPQHYGLFYAMGVALIMEGLLSACYHFCPNKMNFQFDSSFMYVMAVLCMVKLYQNRHPDVNARAHSTFLVLAAIITIGLFGILNASIYFWACFTALHLIACLILTFKIYYVGKLKLERDSATRAWRTLVEQRTSALIPRYGARAALLALANVANWALAAYGLYEHRKDFAVHLLAVLMGNTILYTLFYIFMKLIVREKIGLHTWAYIIGGHLAWFSALYLFRHSRTKWSMTPAQSRRFNQQCDLLDFYDYHDIWHFLSAIAMFLSFNVLLTVDDSLAQTPRDSISVF